MTWIKANHLAAWLLATSAVTIGCIIAIVIAFINIGDQANMGAKARVRQCITAPVSTRIYEDAERRGVIDEKQLALFKAGIPPACLK